MRKRIFEKALAAGLAICVFSALAAQHAQARLADRLVRLHVVAHSDTREDQQLKLRVRDAVLPLCTEEEVCPELLARMKAAAERVLREAGCPYTVAVTYGEETFDTRDYGTFALPAGRYRAVRLTIGAGAGRNWWCVLFPPLCAGASEEEVELAACAAGLTDEDIALITGEGTGYIVRFRLLEIFESFRRFFQKRC